MIKLKIIKKEKGEIFLKVFLKKLKINENH
jgi:hypothetical protein